MKTIAINENNDIYLTPSGNLAIKQDLAAMGDIFVNKAQTVRGELQFDSEKGIDFYNTIFNSPTEIELFQADLTEQLEDTEETDRVYSYKGSVNDGVYSYKAEVITSYGNLILNG